MEAKEDDLSLLESLRGWWRERRERSSLAGAVGALARELWEFLRDSTPERRRQRYGDVDYDWEYRVDTTSATVGWRDRLLGVFHSPYQPTEPALFHVMVNALGVQLSDLTFIDLGSGKGRTLLMASEYRFRRVIGVELLPELHRIAKENIERLPGERRHAGSIEAICGDATAYEFPLEPILLYLFNPLPEAGLAKVIQHLGVSLGGSPRKAYILYHNPLLEHVLAASPVLQKRGGTAQYAIYASKEKGEAPGV
jgi:SAM-dependent methyltransferase